MAIYTQFNPDPGLNNKPPPVGAPEGGLPWKQVSDTFRTVMAAIAEIGEITDEIDPASETKAGLVELATLAEVATGTDATRAVTPAGLAGLTANVARPGLIELATTTEAFNGTDSVRALTPASLAVNAGRTTSTGYIKYPGGLMMQFGFSTVGALGQRVITLPIPHTVTALSINLTPETDLANYAMRVRDSNFTTFSVQMFDMNGLPAPSGISFFWQSVGY